MSMDKQFGEIQRERERTAEGAVEDAVLASALKGFRESVHAWSEAAYHAPRPLLVHAPRSASWRRAWAWSLSAVAALSLAGGGMYQHHVQQQSARVAAIREAQHQREIAAQKAKENEDLLALVDSDVSQQVPTALEPLAQLMNDGGSSK